MVPHDVGTIPVRSAVLQVVMADEDGTYRNVYLPVSSRRTIHTRLSRVKEVSMGTCTDVERTQFLASEHKEETSRLSLSDV